MLMALHPSSGEKRSGQKPPASECHGSWLSECRDRANPGKRMCTAHVRAVSSEASTAELYATARPAGAATRPRAKPHAPCSFLIDLDRAKSNPPSKMRFILQGEKKKSPKNKHTPESLFQNPRSLHFRVCDVHGTEDPAALTHRTPEVVGRGRVLLCASR